MIINCYNENDKCQECGVVPVQFIVVPVPNAVVEKKEEMYCKECFRKKDFKNV